MCKEGGGGASLPYKPYPKPCAKRGGSLGALQFHILNPAWPFLTGGRQTVVDAVGCPNDDDSFPGLFSVPFRCLPYAFVSNDRLLASTLWRSTIQVSYRHVHLVIMWRGG